jgi:hypothetical protein
MIKVRLDRQCRRVSAVVRAWAVEAGQGLVAQACHIMGGR